MGGEQFKIQNLLKRKHKLNCQVIQREDIYHQKDKVKRENIQTQRVIKWKQLGNKTKASIIRQSARREVEPKKKQLLPK